MDNSTYYLENYYGSILDPLHGDIKLSELEKWCIAQPLFSRLRRIKQNTFLYYVFPSANHTRFEHSIGVMHIAGRIFESCKENFATGERKRKKYGSQKSSFFDLKSLEQKEGLCYQELRLAALLHDVGHGPMSHLFDEFTIDKDSFLRMVERDPILNKYVDGFSQLISDHQQKVEHETISCAFIFTLINKLQEENKEDEFKFSDSAKQMITQLSPERIVKIVEPKFLGLIDIVDDKGNTYTEFFSKIVSAFPIDADRMDYLLRDSYFAGVTYGMYDINRIFTSFQAVCLADKKIHLCFRESGFDSILRFIQSRSHLFNQVYFHKTNRAANTMLTYATKTFKSKGQKLLQPKLFEDLQDFYIENSDEKFLTETTKEQKMCETEEEKLVMDHLLRRKLFKRVYQNKIVLTGEHQSKRAAIKAAKDKINIVLFDLIKDNIYAVADYFDNETFKDSAKKVLLAIKNPFASNYQFKENWKEAGDEFKLSDMTVCMVRIYIARTFHSPQEFKEIKAKVLEAASDEINSLVELYK